MTREKHEEISERLRAARESVAPLLGADAKIVIPTHKTTTHCQDCYEVVYAFAGGVRANPDGTKHACAGTPVKHDTLPPRA